MIVIFGASGNTGSAAARKLIAAKHEVRLVGRNRDKLVALAKSQAEIFEGSLEKPDDVKHALKGADVAYLLIPPNLAVVDFRDYQRRISNNFVDALASCDCHKVVVLSSLGANHSSGTGPVVGLHELEQSLERCAGLNVLAIRAGYFMENFLGSVDMVRTLGFFGAPASAQTLLSPIAAADIGRYAARRLAARDFEGFEVVNLIGPETISLAEVTLKIGAAIGKPTLPYVQLSSLDAQQSLVAAGLQTQLAGLLVELQQATGAGLLHPELGTRIERTETQLSDFAQVLALTYRHVSAA